MRQYFIDDKPVSKEEFKEQVTIALKTWYDDHQNLEDDPETYYETSGLNHEIDEIVEDSNTASQTLKLRGHTYMSEKVYDEKTN